MASDGCGIAAISFARLCLVALIFFLRVQADD
jgi:hypothetical protein